MFCLPSARSCRVPPTRRDLGSLHRFIPDREAAQSLRHSDSNSLLAHYIWASRPASPLSGRYLEPNTESRVVAHKDRSIPGLIDDADSFFPLTAGGQRPISVEKPSLHLPLMLRPPITDSQRVPQFLQWGDTIENFFSYRYPAHGSYLAPKI